MDWFIDWLKWNDVVFISFWSVIAYLYSIHRFTVTWIYVLYWPYGSPYFSSAIFYYVLTTNCNREQIRYKNNGALLWENPPPKNWLCVSLGNYSWRFSFNVVKRIFPGHLPISVAFCLSFRHIYCKLGETPILDIVRDIKWRVRCSFSVKMSYEWGSSVENKYVENILPILSFVLFWFFRPVLFSISVILKILLIFWRETRL